VTEKFEKPRVEKIEVGRIFEERNTEKVIEELNLNLYKNVVSKYFFIPGFISHLIINK
jgi:hypothetical protein